jgi:hypothetical protein
MSVESYPSCENCGNVEPIAEEIYCLDCLEELCP